jgi:hypothetical protein
MTNDTDKRDDQQACIGAAAMLKAMRDTIIKFDMDSDQIIELIDSQIIDMEADLS